MKILHQQSWWEFKRSKPITHGSKNIQGVFCYDILANPLYRQQFQYVAADEPNRADFIIDGDDDEGNDEVQSDMVKIALNISFAHGENF